MATQKDILIGVIDQISRKLIAAENELTELDSIGDADCGSGVRRGFEAVLNTAAEFGNLEVGDILKKVGFTLAYTIGGTSGAMLGTGFIETGKSIGDKSNPSGGDWIKAVRSALEVIKRRGGNTQVGDKTLVDALEPALEAMKGVFEALQPGVKLNTGDGPADDSSRNSLNGASTGMGAAGAQFLTSGTGSNPEILSSDPADMLQILEAACMAAKEGSDRTIDMVARKGRASYVGERSRGNRDPGSLIIVIMFEAALEVLRGNS